MSKGELLTPSYYDLLETFPTPGCAVCNLLLRDADHFLDSLLYEFVTDPKTQRAIRAARGLCNLHSGQVVKHRGGSLGVAILYGAALDEILARLQQTASLSPKSAFTRLFSGDAVGDSLAQALEPDGPCLACQQVAAAEQRYIDVLGAHLNADPIKPAYAASDGLCLPHFRQLVRKIDNADVLKAVVSIQSDIWSRLYHEVSEFQRKSDFHYADEAMGAEGTSWQRAVQLIAGADGALPDRTRT